MNIGECANYYVINKLTLEKVLTITLLINDVETES